MFLVTNGLCKTPLVSLVEDYSDPLSESTRIHSRLISAETSVRFICLTTTVVYLIGVFSTSLGRPKHYKAVVGLHV